MDRELVSVIVPVYNKEKYIKECINSIRKQIYSNIEILVIDDGSKDNSFNIISSLSKVDRRIKIFRQENSGVSSARNLGISKAKGSYLIFIDADDYVATDYIERLMNFKEYDFVISDLEIVKQRKVIGNIKIEHRHEEMAPIKDISLLFNFRNYPILSIAVTKLYKAEIIKENHIIFRTLNYGEDSIFVIEYLSHVQSNIRLIDYAGYFNNVSEGTVSHDYNRDVWKQVVQIPYYFELNFNNDRGWKYLYLRSIKLSLLNASRNYNLFKKVVNEIVSSNDTYKLKVSLHERITDKLIVLLIKKRSKFVLYNLYRILK